MSEIARQELGLSALANRLADLTSSRAYILDGLTRIRSEERNQVNTDHLNELLRSQRCLELLGRVKQGRHRHTSFADGVQLTISPIVSGPDLLDTFFWKRRPRPRRTSTRAWPTWRRLLRQRSSSENGRSKKASCDDGWTSSRGCSMATYRRARPHLRALPPPLRLAVGRIRKNGADQGQSRVDDNILREARSIAEQMLRASATPTVAAVHGDSVVVAWSVAQREGRFNATEKLEAIASLVGSSTGARIRFAVSEVVNDPQIILQCYHEARLSAEIRPWQGSAVIEAACLGAYRFIIGASTSPHVLEFSRRTLGKALEHDEKRNGELIGTLRTYLENRSSASLAAQVLGVHVHTVQYRLSRLEELTGLSLRTSDERLTLELALRIHDLAGLGLRQPE